MTSRRTVLSLLAAAAGFSGCLSFGDDGSQAWLDLRAVSPSEVADAAALSAGDAEPAQRRLVDDALDGGTVRYGYRPLRGGAVVVENGTYYEVRVTETGSESVVRPVVSAREVATPTGETGDVSGPDERTLKCAIAQAGETDASPCVVHSGSESVFWPEPEFDSVTRGDRAVYDISVDERNVTLDAYSFELEAVARNRSAYVEYATREKLLVDYDDRNLSGRQREMLRTAAGSGKYRAESPPSDAFDALVEPLTRNDLGGYVKFDGDYYDAEARRSYD